MTAGEIRKTLQREFVRTIRKPFVDAVKKYDMVRPGDSVAVCISGGKDSMLLGLLLRDLQHTVDFELKFLAMDPGYAPEGRRHLEENARKLDIPLEIFDTDVLRIAGSHSAEHPCFLCAKMRRGYLYAPHAFAPQRQLMSSRPPSPLVFLRISTHFTATHGIPPASPSLKTSSFESSSGVKPPDFTSNLPARLRALYTQ